MTNRGTNFSVKNFELVLYSFRQNAWFFPRLVLRFGFSLFFNPFDVSIDGCSVHPLHNKVFNYISTTSVGIPEKISRSRDLRCSCWMAFMLDTVFVFIEFLELIDRWSVALRLSNSFMNKQAK